MPTPTAAELEGKYEATAVNALFLQVDWENAWFPNSSSCEDWIKYVHGFQPFVGRV